MILYPLQIDWLLPTIPPSIGTLLTIFGMLIMLYAHIRETTSILSKRSNNKFSVPLQNEGRVAIVLSIGFFFLTIGVLRRYNLIPVYIALLYVVGSMIEGVGQVRFLRKIHSFLRGQGAGGGILRNLKYKLLSAFVVLLGGTIAIQLFFSAPTYGSAIPQVALIWTLMTFILTVIGLSHRVLPLKTELPSGMAIGYVVAVAGSEVYDLTLAGEVIFILLGGVGYSLGFWLSVYYWLR